jgi:hypothetical protein
VIGALCQTDPVRAFAFLLTIKEAVYRDRMAGAVLEAVARKDGRQAMTLLESLPVGQTRIQALRRIATGWIESGPDELMAYMAGMLPGPDRDALVGAVAWESNRLPAASLTQVGSWMLQGTSGGEPPGQFRGFMSNFAGRDRAAALKFAQSLEGSLRSQALAGVLCQWAESRPQEAAEWASAAGDGPGMDKVLVELSGAWARRDPAAALVWARGMTAVDAKDKSVANVLWHWARSDPRRAATEVASLAGDARDAAVEKVATSWAETEPAEAANWTVTQPDSKRRTQALGQLMVTWAAANPVAASQWLGKQAAGPARDEMVARFSYQSAYLDPDSAMEWAASVGDAGRRVGSMQDVASQWMQNDPAAAREWFRSASLDAATRAALARTIK